MNAQRTEPNLKAVTLNYLYEAIEKSNNQTLKITYCSLSLNNKCMNTKTIVLKINKINKSCEIIEGVILRDNEPYEDIVLKTNQILNVECIKSSQTSDKSHIYELIKNCNGFIRTTQCTKLDKGECKDTTTTFPFLVTEIDERNDNIKGYKIINNKYPEYALINVNSILKVQCLTPNSYPNLPWTLLPFSK